MLRLSDAAAVIVGWATIGLVTYISIYYIKKNRFRRLVKWVFWDFSGLRCIWETIIPPAKSATAGRAPSTFLPWLIIAYIVIFAIASQRYENRVEAIENRANAIFPQLSTPAFKKAISKLSRIQNMRCPAKPNLLAPQSIFRSLFADEDIHEELTEFIKLTIIDWKASLDSVDLRKARMQQANLRGAFMQRANLSDALLVRADLRDANLQTANLWRADLSEANLSESNLHKAILGRSTLKKTKLSEANLQGAKFWRANLQGAKLWRANLQGAKLWEANLSYADLREAKLQNTDLVAANLQEADLQQADLLQADLEGANLKNADLKGAVLQEANLVGVQGLTALQLCEVKSLIRAKMDPALEDNLRETCPQLLQGPGEEDD